MLRGKECRFVICKGGKRIELLRVGRESKAVLLVCKEGMEIVLE